MSEPPVLESKKTGQTMLTIGWIIALAMLTYFLGIWEKDKINPNQSIQSSIENGIAEVVLKQNSQGHYLLNAEVNGEVLTFLVDTGATQVVLTESQAKKVKLRSGVPFTVSTANGNIRVYSTNIGHLKIGEINLYDVDASINPYMDDYGLLGMSALANLEWIQRGDTLILRLLSQ